MMIKLPVPLPLLSCTPSLTTATYSTTTYQILNKTVFSISRILLHAPSSGPQSLPISTLLSTKSLPWLEVKQRIYYKILSLTYKVLTTTQPSYLYNLISVQPHRSTCSSDIITLSRPPSSSSLKVDNRSFRHASPCLWNQLPKEFRLPTDHKDLSLSSDLTHASL